MRLDKFLKVSRIIKRRTVANDACDAEHVSVNGKRAKASYDVKEGDVIVTSGTGSIYPYGLRIGRVSRVEVNEYTRELIAYIEPYHNFQVSDRVMVIDSRPSENVSE